MPTTLDPSTGRVPRVHPPSVAASALALLLIGPFSLASRPDADATESPDPPHEREANAQQTSDGDDREEERPTPEDEGDLEVTTVAESTSDAVSSRQPSGWVTRLRPDGAFARGADLADELDRVEGLAVRRRSSLGQPAFASVRGGSPRQLAVHLNGIRIGAPAGVGFDVASISTGWLDSVDVHRGAAAAPWGTGALTGALNLRARPPEEPGLRTSATLFGGSFGTVGVETEASGGSERLRGDLTASWRKSRGDFGFVDDQGERHTRVNNAHEQLSVGGTLGTRLAGGELSGALLHHRSDRGAPGPSEFQRAYRGAEIASRRTAGTLGWEKPSIADADWGVVDLKLGAGAMHRPLHYSNPSAFLSGDPFETRSYQTTVATTARTSAYLEAGHIAHLDLEVRSEHYRATSGDDRFESLRADRQTIALGVSDEWLLLDDSVSLVGGLRSEIVQGRSRTRTPLTPSAGLIWRALDWLRLKTNVSRSYRLPDFDELYLRTEMVRGNPNLSPERALNLDAGVAVGSESDLLRGNVTVFRNDFREIILFLPQTAYLFRAENLGAATSRGLEASGRLDVDGRYRLRAGYTFTDAHIDSLPSLQLPHQPRHRGSLSNRFELAGLGPLDGLESFVLRADARARSRVNLDHFGNLTNPPHWQLDLGATLRPTRALAVGLELQNATDNRRGADYLQRPLPGRALFASVQYRDANPR